MKERTANRKWLSGPQILNLFAFVDGKGGETSNITSQCKEEIKKG